MYHPSRRYIMRKIAWNIIESYVKWFYQNIAPFMLLILLVDTVAFCTAENGLPIAAANAIILAFISVRMWREYRKQPDIG
jgi:hypothetical protein